MPKVYDVCCESLALELLYPGACLEELAQVEYDDWREPLRRALLETINVRVREFDDEQHFAWVDWLDERQLFDDRHMTVYRKAVGLLQELSPQRCETVMERSEVEDE